MIAPVKVRRNYKLKLKQMNETTKIVREAMKIVSKDVRKPQIVLQLEALAKEKAEEIYWLYRETNDDSYNKKTDVYQKAIENSLIAVSYLKKEQEMWQNGDSTPTYFWELVEKYLKEW